MNGIVWYLLVGMFGLIQWVGPRLAGPRLALSNLPHTSLQATPSRQPPIFPVSGSVQLAPQYKRSLRFNVYSFTVTAADSGRVREVVVNAYRGELLLTTFRVRVDGAVVGSEVADLDNNRYPELYVYSTSDGSGSFGRVYAWQFLPERKADISLAHWQPAPVEGYMGHDSLWVERAILCRKYPVYKAGDANAEPSGGYRMMRYHLQPAGAGFTLVAD